MRGAANFVPVKRCICNWASADRRAAADWVLPVTSISTWAERRPEGSFFTLIMAPLGIKTLHSAKFAKSIACRRMVKLRRCLLTLFGWIGPMRAPARKRRRISFTEVTYIGGANRTSRRAICSNSQERWQGLPARVKSCLSGEKAARFNFFWAANGFTEVTSRTEPRCLLRGSWGGGGKAHGRERRKGEDALRLRLPAGPDGRDREAPGRRPPSRKGTKRADQPVAKRAGVSRCHVHRHRQPGNADTLYSLAWLDVTKEPIVLSLPEMGEAFLPDADHGRLDELLSLPTPGRGPPAAERASSPSSGPQWTGKLPNSVKNCVLPDEHGLDLRSHTDGRQGGLPGGPCAIQDQYKLILSVLGQGLHPARRHARRRGCRREDARSEAGDEDGRGNVFVRLNTLMKDNPPADADADGMKAVYGD